MKIAREAGIYLIGCRSRTVFADCTTPQQKEKKLLEMLQDAGMHGTAADDLPRDDSQLLCMLRMCIFC